MLEVDACIKAFLRTYRASCKLGSPNEGAYYWNEREVQWELFSNLRKRAVSHRIGSEWWFHAEGTVEKPAWARWGARRRADVVMINHSKFKRWFPSRRGNGPAYEAMMELKLVWSTQGRAATSKKIKQDLRKLANCLRSHLTNEAYLILIDGLNRDRTPYYSRPIIESMLLNLHIRPSLASRLHVWHWPDSEETIQSITRAPWHHYTGWV